MARRKESFIDIFLTLPWWASAIAAAVSYLGLKFIVPSVFANDKYLVGVGQGLSSLAPVLASVFIFTGMASYLRSFFVARKFDSQRDMENIRALSWQLFEVMVGEAFRRRGYAVVENGGGGADGGIDLILRKDGEKYLVQCKQWKVFSVGVKPVRELYGLVSAHAAAGGIFVTSGRYTTEAKEFASRTRLELIDGVELEQMIQRAQASRNPTESGRIQPTYQAPTAIDETPSCPDCGNAMVSRMAKQGRNNGNRFWGCSTYPKCRGIRRF